MSPPTRADDTTRAALDPGPYARRVSAAAPISDPERPARRVAPALAAESPGGDTAADEIVAATPSTGLTEAEAASRRAAGRGNTAPPATSRTYGQILRENVFTFINNVIFVLGVLLTLFGRPADALVSLAVIGIFPIELRNGSAITLFTVGIPTALLAVWAQPGARTHESLGRTLARFVVPSAVLSSLAGLAVLFGVIVVQLGGVDAIAGRGTVGTAALDAAVSIGQSALTSFLVLAGLVLVVFVEPPVAWLAVIEPRSRDPRPTILAAALAALYLVLLAAPAGRAIFSLRPLGVVELAIVMVAVAAWTAVLHAVWRYRVVERFLGI
jgi:hypothetical protein